MPKIVYSYDKPVIYFYPEKETKITAKLDFNGEINFTYPKSINNNWEFIANKEGQISIINKKYRYIFWEGSNNIPFNEITNLEEGFIVSSDTIVQFIEKCLTKFAFNDQEIQDFITYWVPEIKKNKLNFIKFLEEEEYNDIAKLTIHPKPTSLIRVFMIWGKTDYKQNIKTQVLPTKFRNGFTVVEWGGSNISSELNVNNIN